MDVKFFADQVKGAKPTPKVTGFFNVKAIADLEHKRWTLFTNETCSRCGHCMDGVRIDINLKKDTDLTIFQAEMLYAVFALNKRLEDYAQYHKCPAGAEFINNIDSIYIRNLHNKTSKVC